PKEGLSHLRRRRAERVPPNRAAHLFSLHCLPHIPAHLTFRSFPAMRVLVIEYDQETANFLKRALKEQGQVAEYAADGQTGLDLARGGSYDVLIVDRMLPKCDGLAVIGTLRAEEVRTPALILSALGEVDDRVKGLRAGGDDYLTKPYSFSELLARIEAL